MIIEFKVEQVEQVEQVELVVIRNSIKSVKISLICVICVQKYIALNQFPVIRFSAPVSGSNSIEYL